MLNVSGESRNVREVSRLPWRSIAVTVYCCCQWLVICVKGKFSAFKEMSEVLDGCVRPQEFAIECTVFHLAVDSFREKNAIGCQSLPLRCSSCAPNAVLEASTVRLV